MSEFKSLSSQTKWRRHFLVTLAFVLSCGGATVLADGSTKEQAVDIVTSAAFFLKANGREKLLAELSTKDGKFHKGDLYVAALDMTGKVLAHPIDTKLVGQTLYDVPDADGKYFRRDFVEIGKNQGRGWVDYKYKNPVSNQVEPKTSYVLRVDDILLIAGVYKK